MQDRIVMNTASLQKHFSAVYEEFFSKNDLVLSAPNSFPWNIGFSKNKNQIHIKQKVPTKTYIGVSVINEPIIYLGYVKMFELNASSYEKVSFGEINKKQKELQEFIRKVLTDGGYSNGLRINFLSENPRGHGFAFSGVSGVLIATVMFLILGKINIDTLNNYDDFVSSKEFEDIFQIGRKLDDISKYGHSVGNNTYTAMVNTNLPTITFCEDYDHDKDNERINININININKYILKDFLNVDSNIEKLHLDYGVIYCGSKNKIEQIHQIYKNTELEFQNLQKDVENILKDNKIKDLKIFTFNNIFKDGFLKTIENAFFVYNFKLINVFKGLLNIGFEDKIIEDFINTIKEKNALGLLFEGDNKLFTAISLYFDQFKRFDDEMLAVFPINTTKVGGSFVFVMKHKKSRETLQKTLDKLKDIGYSDLFLEYSSRLDGDCSDGIVLHQYINKGIFSNYVAKDQVYFKDNQGCIYLGNYNEILSGNNDGLLLDMIHNKIYLNGRKLTSVDIPSQTTTINVLEKLLDNIGLDISNKELDTSSYSKNKNEMIGKIVIPLIKLLEKETKENLPLICKGSIYDFYVKLNKSNIKISLIKKI